MSETEGLCTTCPVDEAPGGPLRRPPDADSTRWACCGGEDCCFTTGDWIKHPGPTGHTDTEAIVAGLALVEAGNPTDRGPFVEPAPVATFADLINRLAAVTQERDEARARVAVLEGMLEQARGDVVFRAYALGNVASREIAKQIDAALAATPSEVRDV